MGLGPHRFWAIPLTFNIMFVQLVSPEPLHVLKKTGPGLLACVIQAQAHGLRPKPIPALRLVSLKPQALPALSKRQNKFRNTFGLEL